MGRGREAGRQRKSGEDGEREEDQADTEEDWLKGTRQREE